jgi:peptide/nickel transport system ATP-binding protein
MSLTSDSNPALPSEPVLETRDLKKHYLVGHRLARTGKRLVKAVDGVSLKLWPGETFGLVGESGCGKSTFAKCLVRLHSITSGNLLFEGRDISGLSMRAMRPIRPRLQMVFQDPYASLNPRRRVGELISEPLRVHTSSSTSEVRSRVVELADLVGLTAAQMERYPHEFSGGQRQRIGIARALALSPRVIIADEPVSALDVLVQAQIINLFADLQERLGLTYLFIAHDLSVIRQASTRAAVMYLGGIVEMGPTRDVYDAPAHPYTRALISAVPVPSVSKARGTRELLEGDSPDPSNPPAGCGFHPRCYQAKQRCKEERPVLRDLAVGRSVACHFPLTKQARQDAAPGI